MIKIVDVMSMGSFINRLMPKTDHYLATGLRLAIINTMLLLAVLGISYSIFWIFMALRSLGIPLPLPVWLILLGTGIPSFVFWFHYGKAFGKHIIDRFFTRGLTVGILGDIPGLLGLYIMVYNDWAVKDLEIYRIIMLMYMMYLCLMPIMVLLGTLDQKNKGRL